MSWFRIVNMDSAEKTARLDIYDQIGETTDWWSGEKKGVAARDFSAALQSFGDVENIELHINSVGGKVMDGLHIYNELKAHKAKIDVVIDGQAASIASIIAMAGDTIRMPDNASFWVHNPMTIFDSYIQGNAEDMREAAKEALNVADDLDTIEDALLNVYMHKVNISRDEMKALLDAETTILAEQAVEIGLATRIDNGFEILACKDMKTVMNSVNDKINSHKPERRVKEPEKIEAMNAKDVIALCKESGLENMANFYIESGIEKKEVKNRIKNAQEIKQICELSNISDEFTNIMNSSSGKPIDVELFRVVLALKLEENDPDISNHNTPGNQDPRGGVAIDFTNIYSEYNS